MKIRDEIYERVFRPRGISRAVAEEQDAFIAFDRGDVTRILEFAPYLPTARALRAGGVLMRRWAVPSADPNITYELRPDWPIWTGGRDSIRESPHSKMRPIERKWHVARSRIRGEDVRRGVTIAEYERFAEQFPWAAEYVIGGTVVDGDQEVEIYGNADGLALGADHDSQATGRRHVHVDVVKYQMSASPREESVEPGTPHAHRDFYDRRFYGNRTDEERNAMRHQHVIWQHAKRRRKRDAEFGDVLAEARKPGQHEISMSSEGEMIGHLRISEPPLEQKHEHTIQVKTDAEVAKRLSIHPRSLANLDGAARAFFCLEGSMKDAAVVSCGEVAFSCPSVTLWNNSDLSTFAPRLKGKRVYVVCDSDWSRTAQQYRNPDQVIRETLLARDRLRSLGVDTHAVAPPPKCGRVCEHESRSERDSHKNGVDDFLGPWDGRRRATKLDELLVIDRQVRDDLFDVLLTRRIEARESGRRAEGAERDAAILRALATYGSVDGRCRSSFESVARWADVSEDAVKRSIGRKGEGSLVRHGAVVITEPFTERVSYHFRARFSEWTGELQLAEEFRATQVLTTIRELERRK